MATPEQFMRGYLAEMVRLQEHWATGFAPVQERYFAPSYKAFEPEKNVQTARDESVVSIAKAGDRVEVTTTGYGEEHGMRYTLEVCEQDFRIVLLEMECSLCGRRGSTRPNCPFCHGKGWKGLPFEPRA
jgi:hypothetical protein